MAIINKIGWRTKQKKIISFELKDFNFKSASELNAKLNDVNEM